MAKNSKNEAIPSYVSTENLIITGLYGGFFLVISIFMTIDVIAEGKNDWSMLPIILVLFSFGSFFYYRIFRAIQKNNQLKSGHYKVDIVDQQVDIGEKQEKVKYYYEGDEPK